MAVIVALPQLACATRLDRWVSPNPGNGAYYDNAVLQAAFPAAWPRPSTGIHWFTLLTEDLAKQMESSKPRYSFGWRPYSAIRWGRYAYPYRWKMSCVNFAGRTGSCPRLRICGAPSPETQKSVGRRIPGESFSVPLIFERRFTRHPHPGQAHSCDIYSDQDMN